MDRPTAGPRHEARVTRTALTFTFAVALITAACGPEVPISPVPTGQATPSGVGPTPSASAPTPTSSGEPVAAATWIALRPTGGPPPARDGHSWTVDPSSAVAYLFGGRGTDGVLDDLWVYDLTADAWELLAPVGERPPPRSEHAAAWIDGLGLVIMGGRSAAGVLGDLWAYDPSADAWRTLDTTGPRPAPRAGACAALRTDGTWWLTGGAGGDEVALADIWAYDPGRSAWTEAPTDGGPGGRIGASCWWGTDDRLSVYGGRGPRDDGPVADGSVWSFEPAPSSGAGTWSAIDGPPDGVRERAASTWTGDGAVVVGGLGTDGAARADLLLFGADAGTVLGPGPTGPPARSGAALVDDPQGERLVLFGGAGATGPLGDAWALTLP